MTNRLLFLRRVGGDNTHERLLPFSYGIGTTGKDVTPGNVSD